MIGRLDLATRTAWRLLGREVDLAGSQAWLAAPFSPGSRVRDGWIAEEAVRLGGTVAEDADGGLLASMADLDGPGFRADDLDPQVRAFYEHTAGWRMDVWTGWSPLFWPGGELVSRLFGRRVEQLSIPTRPLAVAQGMDSSVRMLRDPEGRQVAAAWIRRLRATGEFVYSGRYGVRLLPGSDRPSVHVVFPLEEGNVQVFLRPEVDPDGALRLESPPGAFGKDGAYVVVRQRGRCYAARAPIHESFRVYVDPDGVLRTDHSLRVRGATAVRLHYRLEPQRRS